MNSLVPYRRPRTPSALDAAFADFLRIDVASGDASPDTIAGYRGVVELWVNWCFDQDFDPATATVMHVKRYRQMLIERNLSAVTVRWNLMVVRRFYEAARTAGLRPDNPAAGLKSPRIRRAAEDFNYLSEQKLATLLAVLPNPDEATGRDKIMRLRNLLTVSMMALQGLRTIEVRPGPERRLRHTAVLHRRLSPAPPGPSPHPTLHVPVPATGRSQATWHLEPCAKAHGRDVGLPPHRRPADRAGLPGPRRSAHDLALRARGGYGEAESCAVHSGEGRVMRRLLRQGLTLGHLCPILNL